MKIALVIFRLGPSHGSILQTYALYKILKRLGHEVTIINRQPNVKVLSTLKKCASRLKHRLIGDYRGPVFYTGDYSPQSMINLNEFVDNNFKDDLVTIVSEKELNKVKNNEYDAYIIGSDQTWRPEYVCDIYYYYLDFLPRNNKAKRIAYAPSFGVDVWEYDEIQTKKCKELAHLFDSISVREQSGVELCKKYLDIEAEHVLDPTMLLKREDYEKLIQKASEEDENYIAYSVLDDTESTSEILDIISGKLNLPLKRINCNHHSPNKRFCYAEPSIEDWLNGIRNAAFVVTDSFHATIFSIIFNRPFLTIGNIERGMSRFSSILNQMGLQGRLITSSNIEGYECLVNEPIMWERVNQTIEEIRQKSINYLVRNL